MSCSPLFGEKRCHRMNVLQECVTSMIEEMSAFLSQTPGFMECPTVLKNLSLAGEGFRCNPPTCLLRIMSVAASAENSRRPMPGLSRLWIALQRGFIDRWSNSIQC